MLIRNTETRECKIHGRTPFGLSGERWRCRKCQSEAVTRTRKKNRAAAIEAGGGCCILCGYDRHSGALHFHHLDPSTKEFGLSGSGQTASLPRRQAEIAKCVLLCGNCHQEVEDGVTTLVG